MFVNIGILHTRQIEALRDAVRHDNINVKSSSFYSSDEWNYAVLEYHEDRIGGDVDAVTTALWRVLRKLSLDESQEAK